jgi:hypothetical protein
MRDEHLDQAHTNKPQLTKYSVGTLDKDEIQPLIFDVVRANNLEVFSALVEQFHVLPYLVKLEACKLAASAGSVSLLEMMSLSRIRRDTLGQFYDNLDREMMVSMTVHSIQSGSPDALRYVLSESADSAESAKLSKSSFLRCYYPSALLPEVLESDSITFYEEFDRFVNPGDLKGSGRGNEAPPASRYLSRDIMKATAGNFNREEFLLQLWKKLNLFETCGQVWLGRALCSIAFTTCSVNLATFLLECGADINYKTAKNSRTPLHEAARRNSAIASEFMRFLLIQGADYDVKIVKRRLQNKSWSEEEIGIRDEIGVKNISQWLGMSWDDLIATIENERKSI